jgi:hypothetical protein
MFSKTPRFLSGRFSLCRTGFRLSWFSDVLPSRSQKRQAEACPARHVEILRIRLCSSCATIAVAEEKYRRVMAYRPVRGELSSQSSK